MTINTHTLEQTYIAISNEAHSLSQLIAVNTTGLSRDALTNIALPENDIAWRSFENLIEDVENINKFGKNEVAQITQHAELMIEALHRNEPIDEDTRVTISRLENHVNNCIEIARGLRDSCARSVQAIHDVDPTHTVFTRKPMAPATNNALHRAIEKQLENIRILVNQISHNR